MITRSHAWPVTPDAGAYIDYSMSENYKPPYQFSTQIGSACARQFRTFQDLAEKLKMPVEDLMRQCNGKASPSKALVKGLARELGIEESFLNRLADEVRKDLG
jgi:ribosome-binding protein aMBF1 (putative translation factor)